MSWKYYYLRKKKRKKKQKEEKRKFEAKNLLPRAKIVFKMKRNSRKRWFLLGFRWLFKAQSWPSFGVWNFYFHAGESMNRRNNNKRVKFGTRLQFTKL